jgi:phosphatidylinositol alpha-1,6-mannosyltransferase
MHVAVVCSNLRYDNVRLQPGRYITEIAKHLQVSGHSTTIITDAGRDVLNSSVVNGADVQVVRTVRVSARWKNAELEARVHTSKADVLLWMVGQSSLWHLTWPKWIEVPVIGVFTAPLYLPKEVLRLGMGELSRSPQFYAFYLLSSLAPDRLARRVLNPAEVSSVIVLSQTVRRRLQAKGISDQKLEVIPPGLDPKAPVDELTNMSAHAENTSTALYLGSPQWYRGPDVAIRAVARLRDGGVPTSLTILSRRSSGQFESDEQKLHRLIERLEVRKQVDIISGILPAVEVQRYLCQPDMVLLPFRLIPSEMPLTVIEGMRHGKPVISSSLPTVVDLLGEGRGLTVPPDRPGDLAEAMMSLIDSPARRETIGRLAQGYVESWPTWAEIGRKVETILQQARRSGFVST